MASIWSGDTVHIGINGEVDGRMVVRSNHIFLPMVLRAHAFVARSSAIITDFKVVFYWDQTLLVGWVVGFFSVLFEKTFGWFGLSTFSTGIKLG